MTGNPLDDAPWWFKAFAYSIIGPVLAFEKVKEIAAKIIPKKKDKK